MKNINYISGWLEIENVDCYNVLTISEDYESYYLCEYLEKYANQTVFVSYYITNKKLSWDEVQEEYLKKIYGISEGEFYAIYSEISGFMLFREDFTVGGHDLMKELYKIVKENKKRKNDVYLLMEIKLDEEN